MLVVKKECLMVESWAVSKDLLTVDQLVMLVGMTAGLLDVMMDEI